VPEPAPPAGARKGAAGKDPEEQNRGKALVAASRVFDLKGFSVSQKLCCENDEYPGNAVKMKDQRFNGSMEGNSG
jgi:hypothetical protein